MLDKAIAGMNEWRGKSNQFGKSSDYTRNASIINKSY
jgi:hypothetical protein